MSEKKICPGCGTERAVNKDGTVRKHACTGPSIIPGQLEIPTDLYAAAGEQQITMTASGGPNPHRAPLPTTRPTPAAQQQVQDFLNSASQRGEDVVERDSYGRYLLPHPVTGQQGSWTRATTLAKTISDTYTLSEWSQRNVLKGAALRPDLVALAANKDIRRDKDALNKLCEQAKDAAGSKVAANLGTAVHSFTEAVDRGQPVSIPAAHADDVAAYSASLEAYGLEPVPELIEFTVCLTQHAEPGRYGVLGVAGTSDRCYRATRNLELYIDGRTVSLKAGEYVIGDVKTGHSLDYGWQEIAIQLALYAHGLNESGYYDRQGKRWIRPEFAVRTDVGIIAHLPVDKEPRSAGEARKAPCTLYAVDLESGWKAAGLCAVVRRWRKVRNLSGTLAVVEIEEPQLTVREATFEERAEQVSSPGEANDLYTEAKASVTPDRLTTLYTILRRKLDSLMERAG